MVGTILVVFCSILINCGNTNNLEMENEDNLDPWPMVKDLKSAIKNLRNENIMIAKLLNTCSMQLAEYRTKVEDSQDKLANCEKDQFKCETDQINCQERLANCQIEVKKCKRGDEHLNEIRPMPKINS